MRLTYTFDGRAFVATTEHAASSYGQPVLLVDSELTDTGVAYEPDVPDEPTVLDRLADTAGIWGGPATRRQLAALGDKMLADTESPRGVDYDRVIDAFLAEGNRRREAELNGAE